MKFTNYNVLRRDLWDPILRQLSKQCNACQVRVEVANPEIGDQIESDWVTTEGFSYDPVEDILWVHSAEADRSIAHPRELVIGENNGMVSSISVQDHTDTVWVISLKEPLLLPSGSEQSNGSLYHEPRP